MKNILQKNGLPFTNIPSGKRDDYFETQEKGHKGDYKPFTLFLIDQIKENYKKMKQNAVSKVLHKKVLDEIKKTGKTYSEKEIEMRIII